MNPKYRGIAFIGITFVLMVPYLGFALYNFQRFPSNQVPAWFTNTLAVWFIANFLILTLLARRVFKGQVMEPKKAQRASAIAQSISAYLIFVWSLLFLYGTRETLLGKFPLNRAIPAGAFLLFFIGVFGWSLYRTRRGKA